MIKYLFFIIVFSLNSLDILAGKAYICLPSRATGFYYSEINNSWEQTSFKVGDDKNLLKKTSNGWKLKGFGSNLEKKCTDFNDHGYLFCQGYLKSFKFNKKTLRYIITHDGGYIDEPNSILYKFNPYIEIGVCTAFEE